jgi:hypothetical protein
VSGGQHSLKFYNLGHNICLIRIILYYFETEEDSWFYMYVKNILWQEHTKCNTDDDSYTCNSAKSD